MIEAWLGWACFLWKWELNAMDFFQMGLIRLNLKHLVSLNHRARKPVKPIPGGVGYDLGNLSLSNPNRTIFFFG